MTSSAPGAPPDEGSTFDIDVHGWLRLRFVGAQPGDRAATLRALGMAPQDPLGPADITVHYGPRVLDEERWSLGGGAAAFDRTSFAVTRGRFGRPVEAALPLPALSSPLEVRCRHGVGRVPLLPHLLNVAAARAGGLGLHAAAVELDGRGIVVTGWSKGGKTELLLGLTARGGRYVADEWAYVAPGGASVGGIGEPVRVWQAHLDALPSYRRRLSGRQRAKLRTVGSVATVLERAVGRTGAGRRALPLLERQRHVDVPPAQLFGAPQGPGAGPFDVLVLATVTTTDRVRVAEADPGEVARRAAASLAEERAPLAEAMHQARFAFPDQAAASLDELNRLEAERLATLLASKRVLRIEHPYPVPIEASADSLLEALA